MLFKNLLLVNAILFVPFGIGFVFIPSTLLSLYGVNPESGTIVAAQLYGGLLIAIGLQSWLSREVTDVSALRAIQISFMIAFPINTIVHALGTMSGAMNALGWSAVIAIIYLLLSVGYTYFYFTTTKEQVVQSVDTWPDEAGSSSPIGCCWRTFRRVFRRENSILEHQTLNDWRLSMSLQTEPLFDVPEPIAQVAQVLDYQKG